MSVKQKITISFCLIGIISLSLIARNLMLGITQAQENNTNIDIVEEKEMVIPRKEIITKVSAVSDNDEMNKPNFEIRIPSIGLKKEIQENVDPRYPEDYLPVLDKFIAHGKFTLLPDEATDQGNVYLFAHRSSFNNKSNGFFQNLDQVKHGDLAYILFEGKTYTYKFRESRIVSPYDTYVYTAYSPAPTLTLQTCNNGIQQRLMVWWDLVDVEN